ncbi:hypothetical protein SAY86_029234 [Trapa natans]|uniref:CCT domain-containing protein n=1 Tax=Trapa natans TaxID=22666 RepID=A0AAN7RH52_TRANT|nr:hypothetical protein SAY86_029234 [Trapa natans]
MLCFILQLLCVWRKAGVDVGALCLSPENLATERGLLEVGVGSKIAMSSEFFTDETELQFLFDDPFLTLGGGDSTLDEVLQSVSLDAHSPSYISFFEPPPLESCLSLGDTYQCPQPVLRNAAAFSLPSEGFPQSCCFGFGYSQSLPHSYSGESPSQSGKYLMQRSHSTGDLQSFWNSQSPVASEYGSILEEASFKVARYSAEQRKERILKYRAKRTQRNFNKTIKYACRKTLADSRHRIRGRFARNDELICGDVPKAASPTTTDDDDDELSWVGLHEDGPWSCGSPRGIHDGSWASPFPSL